MQQDSWQSLRAVTNARIALGRTGSSIPLRETLRMKLAHAFARDAVYSKIDKAQLSAGLEKFMLPMLEVNSKVDNRREYLQRPDLGRSLREESAAAINALVSRPSDISIVLADGLSASAVNTHAIPVLENLIPLLQTARLTVAPICIASEARVAIADEIGFLLKARLSLILIGERPGLSSPNSMGAYLTYQPRAGLTDESRNCISNIRPEGLGYNIAAQKIFYLVSESLKQLLSGVGLKENHQANPATSAVRLTEK